MIRGSRQKRRGPIDLLSEHGPDQGVRPGLRTKGQPTVGARPQGLVETIGAPHHEHYAPRAVIAQTRQSLGQASGRERLAAFIAGHDIVGGLETISQGRSFAGLAGFSTFDLDELHRPQAKASPDRGGAVNPFRRQSAFEGRAQAPDAQQRNPKAQFAPTPRWPESTDQIFSIL